MQASLNLLPPEKKRALAQGFLLASIQGMLLIIFGTVLAAILLLFGFRIELNRNYTNILLQTQHIPDDAAGQENEVKQVNAYLGRLTELAQRSVSWSPILERIAETVPEGVELERISIAKDGMAIRGFGADRDDVLTFRTRLQSLPFLSDVSSPLSNILQKKNVNFDFELKYSSELQKK